MKAKYLFLDTFKGGGKKKERKKKKENSLSLRIFPPVLYKTVGCCTSPSSSSSSSSSFFLLCLNCATIVEKDCFFLFILRQTSYFTQVTGPTIRVVIRIVNQEKKKRENIMHHSNRFLPLPRKKKSTFPLVMTALCSFKPIFVFIKLFTLNSKWLLYCGSSKTVFFFLVEAFLFRFKRSFFIQFLHKYFASKVILSPPPPPQIYFFFFLLTIIGSHSIRLLWFIPVESFHSSEEEGPACISYLLNAAISIPCSRLVFSSSTPVFSLLLFFFFFSHAERGTFLLISLSDSPLYFSFVCALRF
eukprot:TRINITY_DN5518_c3_g1_i1.p1 TRINITY_DN5518_c3_g1~~TRINITY_DN5518_c3_g1_i1.p1  ORF type:complete len:301 (+),score=-5.38 TRINITY_DN5518_c3_g1_i1:1536-2438(+)